MASSKTTTVSKTNSAASKTPPFNVRPLVAACDAAERAFIKAHVAHGLALDKTADAFRKAGVSVDMLKGNARTSVPRGVIKTFFDGLSDNIYKDAKGDKVLNPTEKEIKSGKLELVREQLLSKATAATYQTCFWIAFEKNIPFSPSLAKIYSVGGSGKKANVGKGKAKVDAAKVKGSIVVTASRDNLQSLLLQTIKMARDLGLGTFATELTISGKGIDLLPKDFK